VRGGCVLVVVLFACLGLIAGGAAYWWTEIRDRDAKLAKTVLESFVPALRRRDYAAARKLLAESAPPMRAGPNACARRLRRTGIGDQGWSYQLLTIATRVESRERCWQGTRGEPASSST